MFCAITVQMREKWRQGLKQITIERLSNDNAKNETGQRLKRDWGGLPYVFPPEYMEFMELFNGYCGFLGTSYVDLYRFEELIELNEGYQMHEWHPGMTLIGSDGGGMGYAISEDGQFKTFDFTGDYLEVLADSFDGFVDYVFTFDWGDDDDE